MSNCSAEQSTAVLLLRASLASVLGFSSVSSLNSGDASLVDVDLKSLDEKECCVEDPQIMGNGAVKLQVKLGRKKQSTPNGHCLVPIDASAPFRAALLSAVQSKLDELVESKLPVLCWSGSRGSYEAVVGRAAGMHLGNARGGKKKVKVKKGPDGLPLPPPDPSKDVLYAAALEGSAFSTLPSPPCADTGGAGRIVVQMGEKDSRVVCGRDLAVSVKVQPSLYRQCESISTVQEQFPEQLADYAKIDVRRELGRQGSELGKQFQAEGGDEKAGEGQQSASKAVEGGGGGGGGGVGVGVGEGGSGEGDGKSSDMIVNPWDVQGEVDYDKLVDHFGSKRLDADLLSRLESAIKKIGKVDSLHPWIRRGIFFSHRDLDKILDCVESGKSFYLYTGRGPSSAAMHLGHLVPFMMTQWLQKAFDCPLVIQMTDDEKFLWKGTYEDGDDNLNHFRGLTIQNAKDIIACGFIKEKTFIFSDCDYVGEMYPNIVRIWKSVTYSTAKAMFGFDGQSNIGQSAFPAIQAAPSFPSSFPTVLSAGRSSELACLIPCAIDQDPYFRMTRDAAHKLTPESHPLKGKPALFHSKFFPPLQGAKGKMSSSDTNSAIFLTDTPDEIESKIRTHAFSGGQETGKLQREKGANIEIDVSYQWLTFFLDDDNKLKDIGDSYSSGQGDYWATGLVKKELIEILKGIVSSHQERREKVTDEVVEEWMKIRPLTL